MGPPTEKDQTSLNSNSKQNFILETKIVLEAYITMDFDVLDCNYEIFSICQTATREKLSEKFDGTATVYKL
jgi:hypothetical protein